ncbi:MAG: ImmA/IrrE family metallo-endopeptidase [Bacillota bacterium]
MPEIHLKSKDFAKETADELLGKVWEDRGFPVDPVTIANRLGIQVVRTLLPEKVSGAIFKEKQKDPIIVLHSKDSENRRRFTCAHELGHYIYRLNNDQIGETFEWIDFRGLDSSSGKREEEIFANTFAANLLMPEKEVRLQLKKNNKILLPIHFGVSDEALENRLKNLSIY